MFLRVAALAALFVAPFYAQAPAKAEPAAAALPEAREIIDRHIKEVGGREAILAPQVDARQGHAVGAGLRHHRPDRDLRRREPGSRDREDVGARASAKSWKGSTAPMPGRVADDRADAEGRQGAAADETRRRFLQRAARSEEIPETVKDDSRRPTFDGRPCYKVALTRIDGVEDVDFYDVATGLRAGGINTRESPMGTMTMTSAIGGYKKFGNMLVATKMRQKVMGVEQIDHAQLGGVRQGRTGRVRAARRDQGADQVSTGAAAACGARRSRSLLGWRAVVAQTSTRRRRPSRPSGRSSATATSTRRSIAPTGIASAMELRPKAVEREDAGRAARGARRHARPARALALRRHSRHARHTRRPADLSGQPGFDVRLIGRQLVVTQR